MNWKTEHIYMYGPSNARRIGCRYGMVKDLDCLKQIEEEVNCETCPRNIKVGSLVRIKPDKLEGVVHILEGIPTRKVWVEVFPGAQENYHYMTMYDRAVGTVGLLALNIYDIKDLEKIK